MYPKPPVPDPVGDLQSASDGEMKLAHELARLKLAMEASKAAVWDWDAVANRTFWDERFRVLYDIPADAQPVHEWWLSRLHPEDRDRLVARIRKMVETPTDDQWREEFRLLLPNRQVRWVIEHGLVTRDEGGQAIRFSGISIDITERKQAEESLRRRAEEVERLLESVPAAVWVAHDPHCLTITGNRLASELFEGRSGENLSPQARPGVRLFFTQDGREMRPEELPMQRAAATNKEVWDTEVNVKLPSGRGVSLLGSAVPLRDQEGNPRGCIGAFMDITERRKTEEALRESEEQFRVLTQNVVSAVALVNERGEISLVNRAFLRLFELAEDSDILNVNSRDWSQWQVFDETGRLLEVDDHPIRKAARTLMAVRDTLVAVQCPGRTDLKWVLASAEPILDAKGNLNRLICTYHDITERKRNEQALKESELRERERAAELQALLDAAPTQIFIAHDANCSHITGNRSADELLRNPPGGEASFSAPEHLQPRHFKSVRDGRDLSPDELPSQRAAKGERVTNFDFDLVFDNGDVRHVLSNASPLFNEEGRPRGSVQVMTDITDLKTAEKALREIKKGLEATVAERTIELQTAYEKLQLQASHLRKLAGELTTTEQRERKRLAKILHDGLQQHLVAAKLQVEGLIRPINDRETSETANRIENILNEALQVSRTLAAELSPPILHDSGLIAGLEWLSRWMSARHGLKVELNSDQIGIPDMPDDVKAFLFEAVRELLLNVVKHAKTSMAKIDLVTEGGSRLCITVSDHGVGFDAASLLETANPLGGFGLFSIRERIALIGGTLKCDTARGKGVRLTLIAPIGPLEKQEQAPAKPARRSTDRILAAAPRAGKIRIVLVDDHAVMREGLARLLSQEPDFEIAGQASNGIEAVERVASLIPDIVLMDLSMPMMDGVEATRRICRENHSVRIIGLSLYSAEERAKEMLDAGASFYLSKTGPPADLKAAIRTCMGKKSVQPPGVFL